MQALIERVRREPVLATALLASVLTLLVSFGVEITDEQMGAIGAVATAALALVARTKVSPTKGS